LDLSVVQGPFSVAPCQTLVSRFATLSSVNAGAGIERRTHPVELVLDAPVQPRHHPLSLSLSLSFSLSHNAHMPAVRPGLESSGERTPSNLFSMRRSSRVTIFARPPTLFDSVYESCAARREPPAEPHPRL
jgi:hypothetical protein